MRLTSTINVSYKDLLAAVLIIGAGSVSVVCVWTIIYGTHRRIEQPFGEKAGHRQRGLSVLKDITRNVAMEQKSKHKIVDPPVDAGFNAEPMDHQEKVDFDEKPDAIRQVYREEYDLRDASKLTSYSKSFYRIKGDRQNIKLGDTLHMVIQARDSWGRDREEGGDFWFATLATKRNTSGTAGRVVDYDNGTYSAYFTVGWVGTVSLEITLVHPSQVAAAMTNVIWNERDRVEWSGRFESAANGSVRSDDQRCVLRRQYVPLIGECVMTYRQAMGQTVLVCGAPRQGILCQGLSALYSNLTAVNERVKSITRNYYKVFSGDHFKRRLLRGPSKLFIKESEDLRKKMLADQTNLPACQPDLSTQQHGLGYWVNNSWHSLLCRTKSKWEDSTEIGQCFRGKDVYFLGDSTIRQWLEALSGMLGVPFKRKTLEEQSNIHREFQPFNTSLTFRMHPLTSNPNGFRHKKLAFEVDALDSLKSTDCNYVVAIGAWAHFTQWTRESFAERIGLLRDAVLRLGARCPGAKIVVAGPHPRDQPSKESRIYHNDLIIHRMGEILEDAFSQSGALYLDRWDMNLGYPSSKKLHMPTSVIEGEISVFLSYVCGVGGAG